jgi:hypothetical protein
LRRVLCCSEGVLRGLSDDRIAPWSLCTVQSGALSTHYRICLVQVFGFLSGCVLVGGMVFHEQLAHVF